MQIIDGIPVSGEALPEAVENRPSFFYNGNFFYQEEDFFSVCESV